MKPFSLAGLLRLRRLQEEQALASLAQSRRSVHDTAAKIASVHAVLASADARIATSEELWAIAATRSSATSMLAGLAELQRAQAAEVELKTADHADAVRAARSIEKLEGRHDAAARVEELRTDQQAIDELASRHQEDDA